MANSFRLAIASPPSDTHAWASLRASEKASGQPSVCGSAGRRSRRSPPSRCLSKYPRISHRTTAIRPIALTAAAKARNLRQGCGECFDDVIERGLNLDRALRSKGADPDVEATHPRPLPGGDRRESTIKIHDGRVSEETSNVEHQSKG